MKAIENKVGMISVFCVACAMSLPSFADVAYSLEGGTLTVNASSSDAGKNIRLLWDESDKGALVSDWANSTSIADCVPVDGGTFSVELGSFGITNGQPCRIASSMSYQWLDKLLISTNAYAETAVMGKNLYGVRLGYYNTGNNGQDSPYFMGYGSNFYLGISEKDGTKLRYKWHGTNGGETLTISDSEINDIAFTNGFININGTVQSPTVSGAAGKTDTGYIRIGRTSSNNYATRYAYGWWSYVTFYGSDGEVLLDYVPVKREWDEKVGFYDKVTKEFVPSSGSSEFIAGNAGEVFVDSEILTETFSPSCMIQMSVQKGRLTATVPSGLGGEQLILLWDDSDKGSDVASWAHSTILSEQIANGGGTYTASFSGLGVRNGSVCRVVAANCFYPLDKVQSTSGQAYISSGIWSYDVYGVRLGYYNTGNNGTDNPYFMGYRSNFYLGIVESNGTSNGTTLRYKWNGNNGSSTFTISNSEINDIAFTNGIININGTVQAPTVSGAAGGNGNENGYIRIGRTFNNDYADRYAYGWWSYVVFYGADGEILLDYIPAKRVADNEVGFYDRVKKSFVPSSGTDTFIAGTVTNETPTVAVNSCSAAFKASTPGFIVIVE